MESEEFSLSTSTFIFHELRVEEILKVYLSIYSEDVLCAIHHYI
jgi:hypothetical protein